MSNKEVIDKLTNYFTTQRIEYVSRLCANFAVDINRFIGISDIDIKEKIHLFHRNILNMLTIEKFVKLENGYDLDIITLINREPQLEHNKQTFKTMRCNRCFNEVNYHLFDTTTGIRMDFCKNHLHIK